MNVLTFSGNLGGDAEARATKNGTHVTQFSVAMNSGYGDHKKTSWVRCAMFGKRGESVAPYLLKGQQVVVSGEAQLNSWVNKDGVEKTSLECNVNDVTLVGNKPMADERNQNKAEPAKQPPQTAGDFENRTACTSP